MWIQSVPCWQADNECYLEVQSRRSFICQCDRPIVVWQCVGDPSARHKLVAMVSSPSWTMAAILLDSLLEQCRLRVDQWPNFSYTIKYDEVSPLLHKWSRIFQFVRPIYPECFTWKQHCLNPLNAALVANNSCEHEHHSAIYKQLYWRLLCHR